MKVDPTPLALPLTLPCGAVLKNRMVKSAMSDSLGDGRGGPTDAQRHLYARWAAGGAALSLIGEVQVDPRFPEKPGNLVLGEQPDLAPFTALARDGSAQGAHIWPQLGHAGALSHAPISDPAGPSPLDLEGLTCRGMTLDEITALPAAYAQAAERAKRAGFTGVQVHAGHGFLLSQFLSPLFNQRDDAYGGSVANRVRLVGEVLDATRQAVGTGFPIGLKINCTDQRAGGLTQEAALDGLRLLENSSVDLIEISGGTYFPGAPVSSDRATASGPYFEDFTRQAKAICSAAILLTGGIRRRAEAARALRHEAADAVGLARAMVLNPSLPNTWLDPKGGDPDFPVFENPPTGGITAWYTMRLTALAQRSEAAFDLDLEAALAAYDRRDTERCSLWRSRFGLPEV